MKYILIIFIILTSFSGFSQVCGCAEKPEFTGVIPCDTILIDSQSRLYRQFSCDSSWITFENNTTGKRILYTLQKNDIEYTGKMGYQYGGAFKKVFLIRNKYTKDLPPEYILFDKSTGKPAKKIGAILYFSGSTIVYIDHKALDFINVYNIDSEKTQKILLPKDRLAYTLKNSGEIYPESLVENVLIRGNLLTINYKYQNKETKNAWFKTVATLQLK
jgi:hypothetical protein